MLQVTKNTFLKTSWISKTQITNNVIKIKFEIHTIKWNNYKIVHNQITFFKKNNLKKRQYVLL